MLEMLNSFFFNWKEKMKYKADPKPAKFFIEIVSRMSHKLDLS